MCRGVQGAGLWCVRGQAGWEGWSLSGVTGREGAVDVDTQVILGLLSGCDRSFRATSQGRLVVPQPAACQLVMRFKISHLRHRGKAGKEKQVHEQERAEPGESLESGARLPALTSRPCHLPAL